MIKSTLQWLYLVSTGKGTWQTAMINKDDCTLSVVYSLIKIKGKAYVLHVM